MFHFFHKYGQVDDKNFQYCIICGKARHVQVVIRCQHEYEHVQTVQGFNDVTFVNRCKKCGNMENHCAEQF